ncbi:MAG TPA: hypothetical protein VN025_09825 [Candidatus Dormibacteraeota bacterium]|jgi:hypothetical protein|nr:hypothetical protein [Candidatus Dormibacteraeota bacterium]
MVLLWNGESLEFLEAVCAELDKAAISVATPHVDVLLRDPADRYHLKHLKTFRYVLGVSKRDFSTAREILESVAENSPTLNLPLPPTAAYPEPFDERLTAPQRKKSDVSLDATKAVYSSDDLPSVEFLEASLDVLDIPFRRVGLESGVYEVQVCANDEAAAQQLVEEIGRGTSTQAAAAAREDALLQDEPPKSYFLAWFLPAIYWFVFYFVIVFSDNARSDGAAGLFGFLLSVMEAISVVGSFWMVYQALRYEVRSVRYCMMALVPLTCIWYYVERYSVRKGEQRLPIAARLRTHRPPAS